MITKPLGKQSNRAFSGKICSRDSIIIIDNNHIISDDTKIAKTFNDFFSNVVKDLNIRSDFLSHVDNIDDSVIKASLEFVKHPSIIKNSEMHDSYISKFISLEDTNNEIK